MFLPSSLLSDDVSFKRSRVTQHIGWYWMIHNNNNNNNKAASDALCSERML